MSKKQGPRLYYASDKNIFDALTNRKVTNSTLSKLFLSRNTIISTSSKVDREQLAKYFSRLTHDYFDHKSIAENLGSISRRENIASTEIHEKFEFEQLKLVIEDIKQELENDGDVVRLVLDNDGNISVNIQYTEFDYKRAEFSQMRTRDGEINFIKQDDIYVIRNTQNSYIGNVRESILNKLSQKIEQEVETIDISLFDIRDPQERSKFFYELISDDNDKDFTRTDVSKAYVYKAIPDENLEVDEGEIGGDFSDGDLAHIESVSLRGKGVTQTDILDDLLNSKAFHIFKINWTFLEIIKTGSAYEVEAMFGNPRDCVDFSFILKAVYGRDKDGKLSNRRRAPTASETDRISYIIENKARKAMTEIRERYFNGTCGDDVIEE